MPSPPGVGVAHRVRAGLGERELQVAEHLLREVGAQAGDAGQGEPAERDVLGLGRDRQPDDGPDSLPLAPFVSAESCERWLFPSIGKLNLARFCRISAVGRSSSRGYPRRRFPNPGRGRGRRAVTEATATLHGGRRTTVKPRSRPGRSCDVTIRTTSSALRTGRPSIATIASPPTLTRRPGRRLAVVPAVRPARCGGAAGRDDVDQRAVLRCVAEVPRDRRRQVLRRDPDVGVARPSRSASSWSIERRAESIGTAKPTPSKPEPCRSSGSAR